MYKKMIALLLSVCLLVLAGCSQVGDVVDKIADSGEFPVEVAGVTVSARPQQAAVLSPNLADVVLALGYETQLGAVSSDCDQGALSSLWCCWRILSPSLRRAYRKPDSPYCRWRPPPTGLILSGCIPR